MAAKAAHFLVRLTPAGNFGIDIRPVILENRLVRTRRYSCLWIGRIRPRGCLRGSAAGDASRQHQTGCLQHGTPNTMSRTRERAGTAQLQRAESNSVVRARAEVARGVRERIVRLDDPGTKSGWCREAESLLLGPMARRGPPPRSTRRRRCKPMPHARESRYLRPTTHGDGCRRARGYVLERPHFRHDAPHKSPSGRPRTRAAAERRTEGSTKRCELRASRDASYPSCPSIPSAARQAPANRFQSALATCGSPQETGACNKQCVQIMCTVSGLPSW